MKGSCGSSVSSVNSAKMAVKFVDFINLPALPVDIIISYLEDKDLQCFHQVSRLWKSGLESRPKDNQRRRELVQTIRENKENIRLRTGPDTPQEPTLPALAQRAIRERNSQDIALKKIGNLMALMECTNQFETTPTSVTNAAASLSALSTPVDHNSFLTPTSHFVFQDFQKAEESLTPGQKLFQCRKCRGPVPSPATPVIPDSIRRHSQPNRVKLISRLEGGGGGDDDNYSSHLESPQKRECKKAKTLSSVDLSPIPYMSPGPSVASLGEKMSHSLVLSSPCLTYNSSSDINALPPLSSPAAYPVKRSTSCSSIMAIDLPQPLFNGDNDNCSPIQLNLNASSCMDNDSFFSSSILHHHHHVDLSNSLNCSRSCCSPRRLHHNSQVHHTQNSSHFSDSGLSFEGDSIDSSVFAPREYYEYTNLVPSPVVPGYHNMSIERGRDVVNFSDGALSISSYSHLHRSNNSLDLNGNLANEAVSSEENVLECPNPKCAFRFCVKCEESEHPGRSCHMVSSDQFESFQSYESCGGLGGDLSNCNSTGNTKSNKKSNANSSTSGKSNKHKNQKKTPLRRLARL